MNLTSDEQELLELALAEGYYEQPRKTTHTALATELNADPVSVAETLRRIEQGLLTELV